MEQESAADAIEHPGEADDERAIREKPEAHADIHKEVL